LDYWKNGLCESLKLPQSLFLWDGHSCLPVGLNFDGVKHFVKMQFYKKEIL